MILLFLFEQHDLEDTVSKRDRQEWQGIVRVGRNTVAGIAVRGVMTMYTSKIAMNLAAREWSVLHE